MEFARMPHAVSSLADSLIEAGHDVALVGGCVRDELLGTSQNDWDLVTSASVAEIERTAERAPGVRSVYKVGERFGTVGIALEDAATVEISSYSAAASSSPDSEGRFRANALHRDFTVNAIGFDLSRKVLLDPTGGLDDLDAGVLRAPGRPSERFAEDPLRVIRAARFASQLSFRLDGATLAALPSAAPSLHAVAVERVRDELTKLLLGEQASAGLKVLLGCGALEAVLPETSSLSGVTQPSFHDLDVFDHTLQAVDAIPRTPVLRWAALLHDVGKPEARTVESGGRIRFFRHASIGARIAECVCQRLRFSNDDTAAIGHLVAEHMRLGELDAEKPAAVDRAVRRLDLWAGAGDGARLLVSAEDVLELTLADFAATAHRAEAPAVRSRLEAAIAASRERGIRSPLRLPITGADIMREFRLEEGPAVGRALHAVAEAIESGRLRPEDREGALKIAKHAT